MKERWELLVGNVKNAAKDLDQELESIYTTVKENAKHEVSV